MAQHSVHETVILGAFKGAYKSMRDFLFKHTHEAHHKTILSVISHLDASHFVARRQLHQLSAVYYKRYWERMSKCAEEYGVLNVSPLTPYVDVSSFLPKENLIRLGTPYGGWIIPHDSGLNEKSICYLAGAGEDISFDCALVNRFHCNVKIIDPTPRAVDHFEQLGQAVKEGRRYPINNSDSEFYEISESDFERLSYLPVGLAGEDKELKFYLPKDPTHVSCSTINIQHTDEYLTAQCHRLSTLMSNSEDSQIDLLKMDIEGAEYEVIDDMLSSSILPRILLIEFDEAHTPHDHQAGARIRNRISRLVQSGMRCVAIEGTNATFVHGA